jgi:hypothetical protein
MASAAPATWLSLNRYWSWWMWRKVPEQVPM